MSSPSQPSGSASTGTTCVSASSSNAAAATTSAGSSTGNVERVLARAAPRPSCRRSGRGRRARRGCSSTPILSVDLGAARRRATNGRSTSPSSRPSCSSSRSQQQPGVGGQQVRDALRRGVRAVRRAERVVDVEVAAVGELARELRVVLRLARVEAGVLEHAHAARRASSSRSRACDRRHRERRVRPLRPAEVRADDDLARRRARAAAGASAAPPGSACRRRRGRPRAARSGRRGRGRACRRRRRPEPSAAYALNC